MKLPSDFSADSNSNLIANDSIGDLPSAATRLRSATARLRERAEEAARDCDHDGHRTWDRIALVLRDAEEAAGGDNLLPESCMADAFALSTLAENIEMERLSFDFHFAVLSLAKANLLAARLDSLREGDAGEERTLPVAAELCATLDSLLDSIGEIQVPGWEDDQQHAA